MMSCVTSHDYTLYCCILQLPFYSDKSKETTSVKSPGVVTSTVETYVRATRLQLTGAAAAVSVCI